MTPQERQPRSLNSMVFEGQQPAASLVQESDGSFYGTTSLGGTNDTKA